MNDEVLQDEIRKRLTLNWLIQGASEHAGMTLHHLVRDELNALDPRLLRLYDRFALLGLLQYWKRDSVILLGWPPRFWRRAASKRSHPFHSHSLLSKYGGMLAQAARQRALERCKEKSLTRMPMAFSFQVLSVMLRLTALEARHSQRLVELAKRAASMVWGIPCRRLDGELTTRVVRGDVIPARTARGQILRAFIMGLNRIVQRSDDLIVVARATNWLLLGKELVKGTAELICLHGLTRISDETYQRVIDAADRFEFEPWLQQSGGELWRHLLTAMPDDQPAARVLMHLARSPAKILESTIAAVIEQPEAARSLLLRSGSEA